MSVILSTVRQHPGNKPSDVTKVGLNQGSPPMTIFKSVKPSHSVISAPNIRNLHKSHSLDKTAGREESGLLITVFLLGIPPQDLQ